MKVSWVNKKGEVKETPAKCGETLLEVAHGHGIELEGKRDGGTGINKGSSWESCLFRSVW